MKLRLLTLLVLPAMLFVACSDDDNSTPVTPSTNVSISSVVPISGPAGSTVTVKGSRFGTSTSELSILFGGIAVTPTSLTDTEMKFKVPAALAKGATNIEIQRGTGKKVTIQFTVEDPIVGVWTASETDVAPNLYDAPGNIRKIVLTFKADGSYLEVRTDSNNVASTFTGTYVANAGSAPAPNDKIRIIALTQSAPALTAEGIYEVTVAESGISMLYEIVQTDPPQAGITKPTPTAGFGSSVGGTVGQRFVHKFAK